MKAMLLAAGLGTRMEPLSGRCAKPALPVLDIPVVRRLVDLLSAQGVTEVVANAHAHADTLEAALDGAAIPVTILHEPELRGSGGGVQGAKAHLAGSEPFLVLNADMCLDIELSELIRAHRRAGALATLALREDPRKGDFGTIGYDGRGRVRRITSRLDLGAEKTCGLFIGVQVMEPRIFDRMPESDVFHLMSDVYVPALRDAEPLHAWSHPPEAAWWPVGSPAELLEANLAQLAREGERALRVHPDADIAGELRAPVYVGAGAVIQAGASVGPFAVVSGGARIGSGVRMERSLALPDARVRDADLHHAIAWADQVWRDG